MLNETQIVRLLKSYVWKNTNNIFMCLHSMHKTIIWSNYHHTWTDNWMDSVDPAAYVIDQFWSDENKYFDRL